MDIWRIHYVLGLKCLPPPYTRLLFPDSNAHYRRLLDALRLQLTLNRGGWHQGIHPANEDVNPANEDIHPADESPPGIQI